MQTVKTNVNLTIGGMTCVNCQNKIEKKLKATKGILSVSVSYNNGIAKIVYDQGKISLDKIIVVIEELGYEVIKDREHQKPDIVKIICMLVIIVALYVILQSMGILNLLVPSQLADTKMGYSMIFVIGLLTSVHCIAMCGGINLSQCIPRKEHSIAERKSRASAFLPAFAYNLGRVFSYTMVGWVLGLVGFLIGGNTEVVLSTLLQGVLKMIAGLFMVIMGINMLGLFPWLRKFTFRMPAFVARKTGSERTRNSRPFFVGILNGFMPCGPLQSMWIVALAAGNPFAGALSMFLFSLGTVPLMMGLGSMVAALGKRFTDKVMTVGAVLVVVLGLAMLSQGGTLSGWLPSSLLLVLLIAFCVLGVLFSIPIEKKMWKNVVNVAALVIVIGSYVLWSKWNVPVQNSTETYTEAEVVDGVQIVNSILSAGRYPDITVQAGVPVRWVIDAPEGSINGCNYKILIQDYNIEYTFQTGENVIEFTPTKTGTVQYSCWMGMIHGNIFVTDESQSEAVSDDEVSVPIASGYTIPTEKIAVASLTTDENGNKIQETSIQLTEEGFSPAVIVVQSNLATIWNIDNQIADTGSGLDLLAPYYSTQLPLQTGMNSLSLYPAESFDVSTGDHRFYCYVKVVENLDNIDEDAIREEAASFETMIYPSEVFESSGGSCCSN